MGIATRQLVKKYGPILKNEYRTHSQVIVKNAPLIFYNTWMIFVYVSCFVIEPAVSLALSCYSRESASCAA
jgi:hypothetical protein